MRAKCLGEGVLKGLAGTPDLIHSASTRHTAGATRTREARAQEPEDQGVNVCSTQPCRSGPGMLALRRTNESAVKALLTPVYEARRLLEGGFGAVGGRLTEPAA